MDFTGQKAKNQRLAAKKAKTKKKKSGVPTNKDGSMDTSGQYYFQGRWYTSKNEWEKAYQRHYAGVAAKRKKA